VECIVVSSAQSDALAADAYAYELYILQLNSSRLFLTPHFKPIKWLTAELGAAAFCRRGASVAPYAPGYS
jgi:hypothetical protein